MKGKIRAMWRVVIALAMVLSFSLVTAVPAMATSVGTVTVTVEPNTTLLAAKYTINFTCTTALAATQTMTIVFPTATTVPTSYSAGDISINGDLVIAGNITVTDQSLVIDSVPKDIEAGASVELVFERAGAICNPTVGSKTLTVATQTDSDAKTSKAYIIAGETGKACSLYTNKGEFVQSYNSITLAIAGAGSETYWTIEVASHYNSATTPETFPIDLDLAGLTVKSIDGAASTEILGSSSTGAGIVDINAANVTLGGPDCGFTIKGDTGTTTYAAVLFTASCSNVTIQGNILTGNLYSHAIKDLTGQSGGAGTVMTIRDNIMSTTVAAADGVNAATWLCPKPGSIIDGNDVSGFCVGLSTYGAGAYPTGSWTSPVIISNNKSYGHENEGMCADGTTVDSAATYDFIIFKNNEVYDNGGNGINISTRTDDVIVTGNRLYNNEGAGLRIHASMTDPAACWVYGNSIYGNTSTIGDDTTDDFAILNLHASTYLPATHNWWGDASGPSSGTGVYASGATGSGDAVSKLVTYYTPWLGASTSAADYTRQLTTKSLFCQSTVGVDVTSSHDITYIGVANYTANPQGTTAFTALDFFDVYAYAGSWTMCTIKLYNDGVTSSSKAYFWSDTAGAWVECTDQGVGPGYVWLNARTYNAEFPEVPVLTDLQGTPFAISSEVAVTKGDFDSDGDIDLADFVEFAAAYGSISTDANYNVIGDFDDSGDIGLADFVEFAAVYGT